MRMILECKSCHAPLTLSLSPIVDIYEVGSVCRFEPGQAVTPPGRFVALGGLCDPRTGQAQPAQAWINLDDVLPAVRPATNPNRLSGCCGLDGQRGTNQECDGCGILIGTIYSACWTYHMFEPDMNWTQWQPTDLN